MDYKELTEKYKKIKSPEKQQQSLDLYDSGKNSLLETIKKEDANSKKQSKRFYIITAITAAVYIVVFIINPDPDLTLKYRLAGTCYILASFILAALFRKKHDHLKKIWYTSSPKVFLKEAKKRFQFWNPKQLWLVAVIILVDLASIISLSNYFEYVKQINGIVMYHLVFFGLITFGFFMGKREWEKRKKPILLKIEEMLSGFEEV